MIEEEMINEIKQDKVVDDPCLFPKEEWDSLKEWHPVSNIPDPYEHAPEEVKRYHEMYEKLWLNKRSR